MVTVKTFGDSEPGRPAAIELATHDPEEFLEMHRFYIGARAREAGVHPAELASLLPELPSEEAQRLLRMGAAEVADHLLSYPALQIAAKPLSPYKRVLAELRKERMDIATPPGQNLRLMRVIWSVIYVNEKSARKNKEGQTFADLLNSVTTLAQSLRIPLTRSKGTALLNLLHRAGEWQSRRASTTIQPSDPHSARRRLRLRDPTHAGQDKLNDCCAEFALCAVVGATDRQVDPESVHV